MTPVRFGLHMWPQATTWPELRDTAILADECGFDSLWTWDHLVSIQGPIDQPAFDGWSLICAWGALTARATVGLLVGANTLRHPAITAKHAITLDHITGGRAVLGIGGGWVEAEHTAFGVPFGTGFGERLDRLDESVRLIRALLAGEVVTETGRFYAFDGAVAAPLPLRRPLPILVGGSGPTKTLATVARSADMWNHLFVGMDAARAASANLDGHLDRVGRDPATLERTISIPIIIRDDPAEARAAFRRAIAANGADVDAAWHELAGPPEHVVPVLAELREIGFDHVIFRMPAPFDRETIERAEEVRGLLDPAD